MELRELFKTLAVRAGISETDAKLVEAMTAIPDLDVDDDTLAKPITTSLITEAEAETRPNIKSTLTARALNGIDALVNPILSEIFEPAELEEFKNDNKATTKKIAKLAARAKELKASNKPSDKDELNRTIVQLNETITTLKTEHEGAVTNLKSDFERQLYFNKLATKVIIRDDVVPYAKAKDGKRVIADLQETIDSAGGVIDIKTGKIMQKDDASAQLYVGSKPMTVEAMLEKTLTENEYIKKSDGPAPAAPVAVPGGAPAGGSQAQQTEAQRKNAARLAD